jgi:hypothetical protein
MDEKTRLITFMSNQYFFQYYGIGANDFFGKNYCFANIIDI